MAEGFYDKNVGQFILPYDAVREARDPDALLLGFLQETYAAAADLAKWDRAALERKALEFLRCQNELDRVVMPAHSRSKNGVASLAYVGGIHVLNADSKQRRAWPEQVRP